MGQSIPCNTDRGCSIDKALLTTCIGSWMLPKNQSETASVTVPARSAFSTVSSLLVHHSHLIRQAIYEISISKQQKFVSRLLICCADKIAFINP